MRVPSGTGCQCGASDGAHIVDLGRLSVNAWITVLLPGNPLPVRVERSHPLGELEERLTPRHPDTCTVNSLPPTHDIRLHHVDAISDSNGISCPRLPGVGVTHTRNLAVNTPAADRRVHHQDGIDQHDRQDHRERAGDLPPPLTASRSHDDARDAQHHRDQACGPVPRRHLDQLAQRPVK